VLLTALSSSGLYLGSAMVGGSGTILALNMALCGTLVRLARLGKRVAAVDHDADRAVIKQTAALSEQWPDFAPAVPARRTIH